MDLEHIVGYLQKTQDKGIVINVDDISQVLVDIDASFASHDNRKSHSGCTIRLGREKKSLVLFKSWTQKIVTPSSTDAELVALSDMADNGFLVWSYLKFFFDRVDKTIVVRQDNTSTITIAYLARPSMHSRRRYIDIRYFWFKQHLDNRRIVLEYCPSPKMTADLLASIRYGSDFSLKADEIMGVL
jgi:hypothetical protein